MPKDLIDKDVLNLSKPSTANKNFATASESYAGIIVEGSSLGIKPPARIQTVTAEWTVPAITPIAGDTPLPLSILVGIDGFTSGTGQFNPRLTAGVTAFIGGTSVAYMAFVQWQPNVATFVTSSTFPIKAGDTLLVLISVPDINQGNFTLTNKTSDKSISLAIIDLSLAIEGTSAECLVGESSVHLADFSQVTFTNISIGTGSQNFNLSNRSDDIIINTTDSNSKALTSTSVISATSAEVKWLGFE
jgi:hypothetical protein